MYSRTIFIIIFEELGFSSIVTPVAAIQALRNKNGPYHTNPTRRGISAATPVTSKLCFMSLCFGLDSKIIIKNKKQVKLFLHGCSLQKTRHQDSFEIKKADRIKFIRSAFSLLLLKVLISMHHHQLSFSYYLIIGKRSSEEVEARRYAAGIERKLAIVQINPAINRAAGYIVHPECSQVQ